MHDKTTTSNAFPQQMFAGINLKNSRDVEFIGIRKNKSVVFLQGGHVIPFNKLQLDYYLQVLLEFKGDEGAQEFLKDSDLPIKKQVEIYAYFMWGDLDHKPDIIDGILQPSENFRHSEDCPSIKFSNKRFKMFDGELNERDLIIIDMAAREETDIAIASRLGIAEKTLDTYKREKLFKKIGGCQSKVGLVSKAYQNHIIIPSEG